MKKTTIPFEKGNCKTVAHRGVSALECENTAAAFVAAGNRSYFGIETDVHVTADGAFVVVHDNSTVNVSAEDVAVESNPRCALDNVHLYSSGRKPSYTRRDLVIPDLADYIRICNHYDKVSVLELKNRIPTHYIEKMVAEIRELGHLENTIFISFDWDNMVDLRALLPKQKLQFLTKVWDDDLPKRLKDAKLDLDIFYKVLTKDHVRACHGLGIEVNVWTCDDPAEAENLASWGVDYITTNILE